MFFCQGINRIESNIMPCFVIFRAGIAQSSYHIHLFCSISVVHYNDSSAIPGQTVTPTLVYLIFSLLSSFKINFIYIFQETCYCEVTKLPDGMTHETIFFQTSFYTRDPNDLPTNRAEVYSDHRSIINEIC